MVRTYFHDSYLINIHGQSREGELITFILPPALPLGNRHSRKEALKPKRTPTYFTSNIGTMPCKSGFKHKEPTHISSFSFRKFFFPAVKKFKQATSDVQLLAYVRSD